MHLAAVDALVKGMERFASGNGLRQRRSQEWMMGNSFKPSHNQRIEQAMLARNYAGIRLARYRFAMEEEFQQEIDERRLTPFRGNLTVDDFGDIRVNLPFDVVTGKQTPTRYHIRPIIEAGGIRVAYSPTGLTPMAHTFAETREFLDKLELVVSDEVKIVEQEQAAELQRQIDVIDAFEEQPPSIDPFAWGVLD